MCRWGHAQLGPGGVLYLVFFCTGALYRVTSRGNRKGPIFADDRDRGAFLGLAGDSIPSLLEAAEPAAAHTAEQWPMIGTPMLTGSVSAPMIVEDLLALGTGNSTWGISTKASPGI